MAKITRAQCIAGYKALAAVKGVLTDTEYRWRAAAVRVGLSALVTPLVEQQEDLSAVSAQEYHDQRIALCTRLSVRDPVGRPVFAGGRFVIDPAKQPEFEEGLRALNAQHAAAIAKEEKAQADLRAFLRVEMDVPVIADKLQREWFSSAADQDHLEALLHIGALASPSAAADPAPAKGGKKAKA